MIGEDFSLRPVPTDRSRSALGVFTTIVGHVIGVPLFVVSAQVAFGLGFERAIWANFAGGALLAVVGIATAYVGAQRRVSTYLTAMAAFGVIGAKLVNLVFCATFIGWFGVQVHLFSLAVDEIAGNVFGLHLPTTTYALAGSVLMITTSVYGISAIQRLSLWCVPVLFGILLCTFWRAGDYSRTGVEVVHATLSFGQGVVMVAGGGMLGAVVMPDFSRFCRNEKDAVLVALLSLAVALPLIMCLAAYPAVLLGDGNLIRLMMRIGLGGAAIFVVVLATWSMNAAGLYSNSLGLSTVLPSVPRPVLAVVAGLLGTIAALFNVTEFLPPFLTVLSITLPPVGGIIVAYHFLERVGRIGPSPAISIRALLSWGIAIVTGLATSRGWLSLSTLPAADSLAVAVFSYLCLITSASRRSVRPTW